MHSEEERKLYRKYFDIVKSVLVNEDWFRIQSHDFPADEFDNEIADIVEKLFATRSVDVLSQDIKEVYETAFDTDVKDSHTLQKMAADMIQRVKALDS